MFQDFVGFKISKRDDGLGGTVFTDFPPNPLSTTTLPTRLRDASIAWDEYPASPYNARVVELLCKEFLRKWTAADVKEKDIVKAFSGQISYIAKKREEALDPPALDVLLTERRYWSRNTRQNQVSALTRLCQDILDAVTSVEQHTDRVHLRERAGSVYRSQARAHPLLVWCSVH